MHGRCHRVFSAGGGFAGATLVGAPFVVSAGVAGGAWFAARAPDKFELGGRIPHRGPTHSLPFAAALTGLYAIVASVVAFPVVTILLIGLATGYWTHILADACTRTGMPGWPVVQRWWVLPDGWRVRTVPWDDVRLADRGRRGRRARDEELRALMARGLSRRDAEDRLHARVKRARRDVRYEWIVVTLWLVALVGVCALVTAI